MDPRYDSDPRRNRHRGPSRIELLNRAPARTDEDIHICPECRSRLVQPTEWAPVDTRRWRVELRCPDCSWHSTGVFPQHVLDRFDAILDDGAAALLEDLTRLERANMEDEIKRFVGALAAGEILPEDF